MVGGAPTDFLEVKTEPMRALLSVKGNVPEGLVITLDDAVKKLQGLQVVNGIDWSAVEKWQTPGV